MKPRLSNTTLALALASAAVAGCSGGADTGQKADTSGSAFRDGLPPAVRDGDKNAVIDTNTDYMFALRSAALKLTGNYPTQAEIAELQSAPDQTATYAKRIDDYLSRPAFAAQQVQFWRDTFKMGGTLTVQVGATMQNVSLETAPTLAAQLVVQGLPFNQIVTQTKGTCPTFNATTGAFTPADCTNTAGQPVVGVLTDAGVQAQFLSSMAFRRTRWVQETFMCSRFPAETNGPPVMYAGGTYSSPWPITSITGSKNTTNPKIDFHDTSAVICANCHTTINHIAPLFSKFDAIGNLTASIQVITPVA
jgi:hypothetical protein